MVDSLEHELFFPVQAFLCDSTDLLHDVVIVALLFMLYQTFLFSFLRKEESEGKMYLELRFMTSIPPVTTSRQGTSSPTRPSFSPLLSTKSRSKSPSIESQGLSAERMFKASRSRSRSRSSPYEPKKRSHSSSSGASHRKTSGLSPPFQRRRRSSSSESDRPSRSPSPWQERRGRACSPFQERGRPRRSISNSPKHDRLPHNPSGRALSDLSPLSARAQKEVQLKNDEDSYWERYDI